MSESPLTHRSRGRHTPSCGRRATDVRSFWTFGLQGAELREATRCTRPQGHRGRCMKYPPQPPAPLRPITTWREVNPDGLPLL